MCCGPVVALVPHRQEQRRRRRLGMRRVEAAVPQSRRRSVANRPSSLGAIATCATGCPAPTSASSRSRSVVTWNTRSVPSRMADGHQPAAFRGAERHRPAQRSGPGHAPGSTGSRRRPPPRRSGRRTRNQACRPPAESPHSSVSRPSTKSHNVSRRIHVGQQIEPLDDPRRAPLPRRRTARSRRPPGPAARCRPRPAAARSTPPPARCPPTASRSPASPASSCPETDCASPSSRQYCSRWSAE